MGNKHIDYSDPIVKIEKNAKMIKALIAALVVVCGVAYTCFAFIYQSKECTKQVKDIWVEINAMKTSNKLIHDGITERISQNERNFNLTSVKLETSLAKISTDIQFIKEQFIRKGMDK